MIKEGDKGYHAIPLNLFNDPFPVMQIGKKGRVHLGPDHAGKTVLVYISESNEISRKCNIVLLDKNKWREVTQTRGKNKGKPLTVFSNGDICAEYKEGWFVKVFVLKDKGKVNNGNS
jgi:hypothetical protein